MKRIRALSVFILLAILSLPSCCQTEARGASPANGLPGPTPRMRPEYRKVLEKHQERDYFHGKYEEADPEDGYP